MFTSLSFKSLIVTVYLHGKHDPSPGDKILALFKSKAFADDNSSMAKVSQFFFDWRENIVGKGENAGYQHFLLFLQMLLY
jgi:hypothetical protein